MSDVKHPCVFSDEIVDVLHTLVEPDDLVLDPFAGVGTIHQLNARTVGVELEPEWANCHPDTVVGDAHQLPFADDTFDVVCTSPVYGNRMSDHHEAKDGSKRITYRHVIGRPLSDNNAGMLQWGDAYREFHLTAWREAQRVLKPGGRFLLNVSDHIRGGERMQVTDWHLSTILDLGMTLQKMIPVHTQRMGFGANSKARVDHESVLVMVNADVLELLSAA